MSRLETGTGVHAVEMHLIADTRSVVESSEVAGPRGCGWLIIVGRAVALISLYRTHSSVM